MALLPLLRLMEPVPVPVKDATLLVEATFNVAEPPDGRLMVSPPGAVMTPAPFCVIPPDPAARVRAVLAFTGPLMVTEPALLDPLFEASMLIVVPDELRLPPLPIVMLPLAEASSETEAAFTVLAMLIALLPAVEVAVS